ncbi:hypothetical protein M407DRAFT_6004 [Tulasnella calospora MUT 4182]|uniref:Uncharacterized protein n=1 Tax=Tulasnella calospora MUT 4182 TaxID=1051891 RepID=A0A0C3QNM0_9AGAM|nr:hypothetical protein M407DRAFT_6004 [Tulasnella calospora MUT 4182]
MPFLRPAIQNLANLRILTFKSTNFGDGRWLPDLGNCCPHLRWLFFINCIGFTILSIRLLVETRIQRDGMHPLELLCIEPHYYAPTDSEYIATKEDVVWFSKFLRFKSEDYGLEIESEAYNYADLGMATERRTIERPIHRTRLWLLCILSDSPSLEMFGIHNLGTIHGWGDVTSLFIKSTDPVRSATIRSLILPKLRTLQPYNYADPVDISCCNVTAQENSLPELRVIGISEHVYIGWLVDLPSRATDGLDFSLPRLRVSELTVNHHSAPDQNRHGYPTKIKEVIEEVRV